MAPHNTGSKRLKNRRQRGRQRNEGELLALVPELLKSHSRNPEEVVKREWTEADPDFLSWSSLHPELDPSTTAYAPVSGTRAARKRVQIASILSWAEPMLRQGGAAVDFCGGSGHLGLVLAAIRPDSTVYVVERKQNHCDIAEKRAQMAGLSNVRVVCCDLSDFQDSFDVGLGLHACGPATDLIHSRCLAAGAAYVLAPCCYGFIAKALDRYKLELQDIWTNSSMVMVDPSEIPDPVAPEATTPKLREGQEEQTDLKSTEAAGSTILQGSPETSRPSETPEDTGKPADSGEHAVAGATTGVDAVQGKRPLSKKQQKSGSQNLHDIQQQMYKEAVLEKTQAIQAWNWQRERERAAPLQKSVELLDQILVDVAEAQGVEGQAQLHRDSQRLKEVQRIFWGSGVMYPRSLTYKEAMGMHLYSCMAGSADCTYWATERMYEEGKNNLGKMCMVSVDLDRSCAAEEIGYKAAVAIMCGGDTEKAGLKNSLIIGKPQAHLVF